MEGYKFLSSLYLKSSASDTWFDRAHNEYLEIAIELGIPFAALLFGWMLAGITLWIKKLFIHPLANSYTTTILGRMSFLAVVGLLIHSFFDFPWRLPANLVYAVTLTALINGIIEGKVRPIKRRVKRKKLTRT